MGSSSIRNSIFEIRYFPYPAISPFPTSLLTVPSSLGCFGELRQAIIHNRPCLLSQSSAELLLGLIPERESPVKAIRAALRQYDIPRATVYTFHPNEALLFNSRQTARKGRSLEAKHSR